MPFFGVPIRNGLPIGLGSVAGFGVQQFDPSQLFEGGTVAGAWYDPSDLSTMFTTAAGTTPVAMPGLGSAVPVGLMLDKSQGLVLGPELVTNGGPFVNTTGWLTTSATPLSVSSGILTGSTATATDALIYGAWLGNPGVLAANKYFEIKTTITALTGRVRFKIYGSNEVGPWITAPGTYTIRLYQTNANGNVGLNTDQATTVSILFFSVKQVAGNHAIAFNNTTARPELRARVNLLTYSEEFDNGAWGKIGTTVTPNTAVAPDGTTTADSWFINSGVAITTAAVGLFTSTSNAVLSGGPVTLAATSYTYAFCVKTGNGLTHVQLRAANFSNLNGASYGAIVRLSDGNIVAVDAGATATVISLSNGWFKIAVTFPATAASWYFGVWAWNDTSITANGTEHILLWGADLRPANIGANVPAYQRIADANTYDTNGFPLYLSFDGIDDSMYTPANLNLSGTDKVAVFAGVRKLSDAAAGIVTELSVNVGTNAGSFFVTAPENTGLSGNYASASRGSAGLTPSVAAKSATTLAPVTNVVTATHDIPGDLSAIRLNGAASGTNGTGDKGSGNFGTYPLFIGARNNSAFWLNGHLHSLIITGSAVSAGNISATEQYIANKTGISI